ncbi:MAG TPA: DUF1080 domain-containing protein [Gemmata sp.]|jgi:hypothetical protein|nr:DUF1080 domain-containing protein [Gemmata sp.]
MRTALKLGALVLCVAVAQAKETTAKPTEEKVPEGFTSIFNGKDLTGWKATGKMEQWAAEPGLIVCKGGGGGWLLTEKEYGNFEFRCEYKWSAEGGNSGVALRTPDKGDPAYVGMEIQLIDDENWEKVHKFKLGDAQHTGSIYGVQAPKLQANKPIGEWNFVRIVADGRKVTITLNEKELVNANLDDYKSNYKDHPGLTREKGHVGFQSYNIRVDFRNVYIKELAK